jgi:hypothetical protein
VIDAVPTSQRRPRWWKWIFIVPPIAGFAVAILLAEPRRGDGLTLLDSSVKTAAPGQRFVTGSVRNNTDKEYDRVQLDIDMLAADGSLLATAYSSTTGVAPHTTWTFTTPIPFENATRFRITKLSCRRDGETGPRLCSLGDTVEVGAGS